MQTAVIEAPAATWFKELCTSQAHILMNYAGQIKDIFNNTLGGSTFSNQGSLSFSGLSYREEIEATVKNGAALVRAELYFAEGAHNVTYNVWTEGTKVCEQFAVNEASQVICYTNPYQGTLLAARCGPELVGNTTFIIPRVVTAAATPLLTTAAQFGGLTATIFAVTKVAVNLSQNNKPQALVWAALGVAAYALTPSIFS